MEDIKGNGNGKSPNKSLKNLRPQWKPGQSGNPAGMPKGTPTIRSFTEVVKRRMAEVIPDDPTGRTRLERLADELEAQALGGGAKAADLLLERIDPAPKQNLTINNVMPVPIADALRRINIERLESDSA